MQAKRDIEHYHGELKITRQLVETQTKRLLSFQIKRGLDILKAIYNITRSF